MDISADGVEFERLRRRIQQELKLLQNTALAIGEAPDFHTALQVVLRHVCEATDWEIGEAWLPNATGTALECASVWSGDRDDLAEFLEASRNFQFAPGEGLPGRVWIARKPEWIPNVSNHITDLFVRAEWAHRSGLKAGVGLPILANDRVLVVLTFFMLESRQEDRRLVELVTAVAAQLGATIQRKQIEKVLRDKEAFLQLVLDNIPQFIFWKDRHSVYLGCNANFARLVGLSSPHEIVGKTDNDLPWTSEQAASFRALDRQVMETNTPIYGVIERQLAADGREGWSQTNKVPLHDSEGRVIGVLGSFQDISEQVEVEATLRHTEEKYRSIVENAVEGIFQTTSEGHYLTANPMLARIYGYDSPAELMETLTDIQHQLYVNPERRLVFRDLVQVQGAVWGFESQVYRKDGSIIWISESARAIRDANGEVVSYEGTVEDITQRKQAEAELLKRDNLLQGVAEATNYLLTDTNCATAIAHSLEILGKAATVDYIYIYECDRTCEYCDHAVQIRYEWTRQSLPAQSPLNTAPNLGCALCHPRWLDRLAAGQSVHGLVEAFPDAERTLLEQYGIRSILMVPILIQEQFWGYAVFNDCQSDRHWSKSEASILMAMATSIGAALKREQSESMIRYQAFHDLLTGLPNRMQFNNRLPASIVQAGRHGQMLAVMFLDLDRFKTINDTLGHAVGDQLLQCVAERLVNCLREGDIVSRWGGDEFTILLPKVSHAEDASRIAQRILDALKPAFCLEGYDLHVSSSIGIALYPQDGQDMPTLLRNADAALYRAKEQGRNNYQFYLPALNSEATKLLAIENGLHRALERNELVLHYQPQLNLATGEISRIEALIRWEHPEWGLISPKHFIPLAEETGLIVPIGDWALQAACRQSRLWQEAGLYNRPVAVNLSARQFQKPDFVDQIVRVLQENQLDPASLELEITESIAMENIDCTIEMLQTLRRLGIGVALDDFGAGCTSLRYLKELPLSTVKIDQSFIRDVTLNSADIAIVNAVIALGRALHLRVVVEGVETQEQMEILQSLHCEEIQGYLFSHPLPAAAMTDFLQQARVGSLPLQCLA